MKKIAMLLALLLCVMLATTALAADQTVDVAVRDASGSSSTHTFTLTIMDKSGNWNVASEKIKYGATRVNQYTLMQGLYNGKRAICTVATNDVSFELAQMQIPSSLGIESTDKVNVYYGEYDENYTEMEHWISKKADVVNDAEGFWAKLPKSSGGETQYPVVIVWEKNDNGQLVEPILPNPPPAPAPAGGAVNMPQTGDGSNLALMFILLSMSVATLCVMKIRRCKN